MLKPLFALVCFYFFLAPVFAQSEESNVEAGATLSILHSLENDFLNSRDYKTNVGVSGRFTYHFNNSFSAEAETTFFVRKQNAEFQRPIVSVFGIKAGKRHEKVGFFAKIRPGIVSYTEAVVCPAIFPGSCPSPLRSTKFALDLGGVMEFYPSRHLVTRIDIGDTLIRSNNNTGHHLQTTVGIGWRF